MTRCTWVLDRLEDTVVGALDRDVTSHLEVCSDCRELVEAATAARSNGGLFAGVKAPQALVDRLKRLPRLAAGCEHAQELIALALDDEISAGERSELLDHMHVCPACRATWDAFATLREVGAATRVPERFRAALAIPPRHNLTLRRRRKFFDLRLATAAAYLLAALSVAAAGNPGAIARAGTSQMEKATFYAKAAVENRLDSYADKAKRSALEVAGWVGEVVDDARTLARRMFGKDANPAASDDVVPDENGGNR